MTQAYFLAKTGQPCFDEPIEAWNFGPVVLKVWDAFRQFGDADIPLSAVADINTDSIPSYNRHLINDVVNHMANESAAVLEYIIRHQQPWQEAYRIRERTAISMDVMREYFSLK